MTTQTTINNSYLRSARQIEGTTRFDNAAISTILKDLKPCLLRREPEKSLGVIAELHRAIQQAQQTANLLAPLLLLLVHNRRRRFSSLPRREIRHYAGAMANGISSEELVIALGKRWHSLSWHCCLFALNKSINRIRYSHQTALMRLTWFTAF